MPVSNGGNIISNVSSGGNSISLRSEGGNIVFRSTEAPVNPMDGTAAYGPYMTTSDTGGQVTTMEVIISRTPDPNTIPAGQLFTVTETYRVDTTTAERTVVETRTCNQVTAPQTGGNPGVCSNPNNAIGGTDTRTIVTPASTVMGPNMTRTVRAIGTMLNPFTFADATSNLNIEINRRTGVLSGLGDFDSGYANTVSPGNLTFNASLQDSSDDPQPIVPFGSLPATRSIPITVTGTIPLEQNFENEGTSFSLNGNYIATQLATDVPPLVAATSARFNQDTLSITLGGSSSYTLTVEPNPNGQWNITVDDNNITISPQSGNGTQSVTFTSAAGWDSSASAQVRAGTSNTGAVLQNITLIGLI